MKTMTELVSWFQMEYPRLVRRMKNSNHHLTHQDVDDRLDIDSARFGLTKNLNPYHIEGDVWTHTMMVCKQAENAPYTVKLAALLHDIGKPDTRAVNSKNGRVGFFNHDAVSAFKALEILKREELGLTENEIAHIFNVIALHTQIYKLSREQLRAIGNKDLVASLIDLGRVDHAGRFHTAGEAEIPKFLDIFPIPESGVSSTKRMAQEKEVVILCGLPASGKSTWVRNNSSKDDFHVSRDACLMREAVAKFGDIHIPYNEAFRKVKQNKVNDRLEKKFKEAKEYDRVIVDMTHMSKKSRKRSLSHFGPEYKKKCVVFLTDLPTLLLRNSKRDGKVIDERVIERMMRSFYPPSFEEFDEIEYIIGE